MNPAQRSPFLTTPTTVNSHDQAVCRLVGQVDATHLFHTTASPWSVSQPPIIGGMSYCLWQGHSTQGAVQGATDYNLIVGVIEYRAVGHFIAVGITPTPLGGVGDKAIFEHLNDTTIAVEYIKHGKLVLLYYGVGPYSAANLHKVFTQRDPLVVLAQVAASRT
jgi:hypothetical protein